MIALNINVTRIDKTAIHEGRNGKYVDLLCFDNKGGPDQFGNDGFVVQSLPQDRREGGEKGPIVGNFKRIGKPAQSRPNPAPSESEDEYPW